MYLSFALKIHLATFLTENKFLRILWPRILIICLVALNTESVFLEALRSDFVAFKPPKMTFSAKKLKLMKICLLHCKKTVHFIRKKHFSCTWALLLKLHLATFSHLRKQVFEHLWASLLIICLVALNTESVFFEALKKWFCAFKLLKWLFLQKSSNSWKSVFCIGKKLFISLERTFFM